MSIPDIKANTWHDVLMEAGIDASIAKSLIGFISWNKGDEFPRLGIEITEVLKDHSGKVIVKDAVNKSYGDRALLFFSADISESMAEEIFDVIMNYEQKEVYSLQSEK